MMETMSKCCWLGRGSCDAVMRDGSGRSVGLLEDDGVKLTDEVAEKEEMKLVMMIRLVSATWLVLPLHFQSRLSPLT